MLELATCLQCIPKVISAALDEFSLGESVRQIYHLIIAYLLSTCDFVWGFRGPPECGNIRLTFYHLGFLFIQEDLVACRSSHVHTLLSKRPFPPTLRLWLTKLT